MATTSAMRVHDALRAAIMEGEIGPGERLRAEALAERFGTSRTPVREALLMLEREGRVRFERNRGVRVLETTAHDLEEVFALRLLLEVPATRRACDLLSDADLAALARELRAMERLAEEGDEGAFMAHDKRFHEIILRASGNRRLAAIVSQLRDLVRFRGASTVGRSRDLQAILSEHVVILDALRARDAEDAARAMRAHLLETGRLLLAQESAPAVGLPWADVAGG
jgi:DNA-binding GntR family transcriptional regulator